MIEKRHKTIEVEVGICDVCHKEIEFTDEHPERYISKCFICGKDVCNDCVKVVDFNPDYVNRLSGVIFKMCKDCYSSVTLDELEQRNAEDNE